MAIQTIKIGTYANDGTGDDLRTAFEKVNANFQLLATSELNVTDAVNIGTGTGIFAQKNGFNLEFKKIQSNDGSIGITSTTNTIDLTSVSTINNDPNPTLGNNLNLNGFNIINGGDLRTTVFGYSIPLLNAIVESLLSANQFNIDFGTFENPNSYNNQFDMGTFTNPKNVGNNLDFGSF